MRLDKILPSFSQASFPAYLKQLRWGTKTVCILAACAITLLLVRKAFAHIPTRNTIPLAPPIPITKKNDPLPVEPQLAAYLQKTLLISSTDKFAKKLGTQLDSFPSMGMTTLTDIQCLGLFMHIFNLQELEKNIVVTTNTQILESIETFLDNFQKTNTAIQNLCLEDTKFDLTNDITKIQTALKALTNSSQKLQRNKKTLEKILSRLKKLDRKRQVCWLKGYLLQPNLIAFWNKNTPDIQFRSLSRHYAYQKVIKHENLFQLGSS